MFFLLDSSVNFSFLFYFAAVFLVSILSSFYSLFIIPPLGKAD